MPVTPAGIEELSELEVDNYEDFDSDAKALAALVKLHRSLD